MPIILSCETEEGFEKKMQDDRISDFRIDLVGITRLITMS